MDLKKTPIRYTSINYFLFLVEKFLENIFLKIFLRITQQHYAGQRVANKHSTPTIDGQFYVEPTNTS